MALRTYLSKSSCLLTCFRHFPQGGMCDYVQGYKAYDFTSLLYTSSWRIYGKQLYLWQTVDSINTSGHSTDPGFQNISIKLKSYFTTPWRYTGGVEVQPIVLYGCETWSLTLREERKLRVFENMVLRRIFGPRRVEVTGEWRRLHNE